MRSAGRSLSWQARRRSRLQPARACRQLSKRLSGISQDHADLVLTPADHSAMAFAHGMGHAWTSLVFFYLRSAAAAAVPARCSMGCPWPSPLAAERRVKAPSHALRPPALQLAAAGGGGRHVVPGRLPPHVLLPVHGCATSLPHLVQRRGLGGCWRLGSTARPSLVWRQCVCTLLSRACHRLRKV